MDEEQKTTPLEEESALLKAYKNLEANSVSREQYEKEISELKEKNALYLKAITEGANVDTSSEKEYNIQNGIAELSKFKGTNLDYFSKLTELTDHVLKILPESEIVKVAGADGLDEIVKVNTIMGQMVKDANNDPDLFRTLYKQRVQDSAPKISADIEKNGGLVNYLESLSKK